LIPGLTREWGNRVPEVHGSSARPATATEIRGTLPAGTRLRTYQVAGILGHGAFGITYLCRDEVLGRDVAIKEYLPTALAVREGGTLVVPRSTEMAQDFVLGRERFLNEARTLALLDGAPAVVRVIDFLEANGTAYTVMALAKGETLERRLRREGPLTATQVAHLLPPLLDGLEQVHGAGFLHRDIKPSNIIVDEEWTPTLIDFGAARMAIAERSSSLTAIFTPGYAAAEQFTAARQGPWTDIYGLAATLYHAITGAPPPSAFDRMVEDTCKPLVQLGLDGMPRGLLVAIDAGLAVRATDRPQSIAGWRSVLEGRVPAEPVTVKMDGQSPALEAPAAAPASPPRRARTRWIALAAAAVLVGALGTGFYWYREQSAADIAAAALAAREEATKEQAVRELANRQQTQELKTELHALRDAEAARARAEQERAERQMAEDARRAQEAAAAAAAAEKQRAEEQARRDAETTESALKLTTLDRQRVQVALTALGFGTAAHDGAFGEQTRRMIAAWQKARSHAPTGYLTAPHHQALLGEAMPAVARFDEEQKKKAEDEARRAALALAQPPAPAAAPQSPSPPRAPAAAPTPAPQAGSASGSAAPAARPSAKPEEKTATLANRSGLSCSSSVRYAVRIHADRMEVRFSGGWQSFPADSNGDFKGSFTNAPTGNTFSVSGSLKTRQLLVINTKNSAGCSWSGTF
jgi:serine/threonine protein kinase/peptidoglycan hydrolase-like protein with peptidoglycan-binding domain